MISLSTCCVMNNGYFLKKMRDPLDFKTTCGPCTWSTRERIYVYMPTRGHRNAVARVGGEQPCLFKDGFAWGDSAISCGVMGRTTTSVKLFLGLLISAHTPATKCPGIGHRPRADLLDGLGKLVLVQVLD